MHLRMPERMRLRNGDPVMVLVGQGDADRANAILRAQLEEEWTMEGVLRTALDLGLMELERQAGIFTPELP